MRFELNIDYPVEKMEHSRARLEARGRFAHADRVPVGFCLVPRFFAPLFGLTYRDYFRDAETQYYWQLQFAKYRIERIPEDIACTAPVLYVQPYFDNVIESHAMGAEVVWPENETLQACPTIRTVDAMERFEPPPPDAGLWGTVRAWSDQMRGLAADTRLTFNGVPGRVEVGALGISGIGPHMIAVDLVGVDFYWWIREYPDACHQFLDKITNALVRAHRCFRGPDAPACGGMGLAEDTSQIMSLGDFRTFCVPYDGRLYDTFAGPTGARGMHMCGQSTHLHPALVEDLRITDFNIFGYPVAPEVAARTMGGKVRLWGNVNPMLMRSGTKDEVKAAALRCLEALAPCGGFMLGDGANVCPGTPLENLAAMTEAAEEYGVPPSRAAEERRNEERP